MAEINLQKICDIANVDIVASLKYALNNVTNCYGFIEDLQEIINDEFDHDAIKTRKVYDYLYRGLVDNMVIYPDLFDEVELMKDEEEEEEDAYEEYIRRFK
ncbi:hypothetical protein [uncultured Peptoniphilus sp.]|uniref:hypothetical protein n=1 Tax=uncultured Peptoniphilus sp. TaxID=254354 RepID=UPI002597E7E1|nr:hypothetical protein [uncultured Peptoniphilus sp.]